MTTSFPETKTGLRLGFAAAVATCAVFALIAGSPARAEDKVLAKVNGVEIKESDVAMAEEELAPSLQQMDAATRKENVLGFMIDLQIVAKAAEDKKKEEKNRATIEALVVERDSVVKRLAQEKDKNEKLKSVFVRSLVGCGSLIPSFFFGRSQLEDSENLLNSERNRRIEVEKQRDDAECKVREKKR